MTIKKHILVIALLFLAAFFIGIGALVVVQAIPSTALKQQSATALAVFEKAGIQRPALIRDINATRVDYYADAHMYQLSFGVPGETNMTNALFPRSYFPPNQPDEMNNVQEVAGLKARLQGTAADTDNGRYWNGFIIPMKIFGSLFSYNGLRILNGVFLAVLFVAAVFMIARMLDWPVAACFILSLVLMWVWVVPLCLEYMPVFYIMGAGVIAVLLLAKKGKLVKWGPELFLLLGILTAYLDLFTAPLVTLGFPLVVAALCLLRSNHRSEFAYLFKHLLVWTLLWLLGFAGFWAAKIFLTQSMFGYGVLADATSRLGEYTSPEGARPLLSQIFGFALPANLGTLIGRSGQDVLKHYSSAWVRSAIAAVILCVPPVVAATWARLRKLSIGTSAILLLIATLPFLRMMVTSIHSDWNSFFTFREFGVASFAVFTFCVLQVTALRKARAPRNSDAS
ncbi:MAG: hypothetical protein FWF45_04105 [Coriobacteriia bacterium]|nr:hypothetical protein [Coriobacteriia bacterium]